MESTEQVLFRDGGGESIGFFPSFFLSFFFEWSREKEKSKCTSLARGIDQPALVKNKTKNKCSSVSILCNCFVGNTAAGQIETQESEEKEMTKYMCA